MKEMREMRGSRTVFDGVETGDGQDETQASGKTPPTTGELISTNGNEAPKTSVKELERRLPPSEREALPNNVFVTSKEFSRVTPKRLGNGYDRERKPENGEDVEMNGEEEVALWERVQREYDGLEYLTSERAGTLAEGNLLAWKVSLVITRSKMS